MHPALLLKTSISIINNSIGKEKVAWVFLMRLSLLTAHSIQLQTKPALAV
jgi:hypothetical protein